MVKIEKIAAGASASIQRNGVRIPVIEKQLISYDELTSLEVSGGDVVYSVDEQEVFTKSPNPTPTVPPITEPKLSAKETAKKLKERLSK